MTQKPNSFQNTALATGPGSERNSAREAAAALNFWQALEYLAPQAPPAVKLAENVWALAANTPDVAMPWNDPAKQAILTRQLGPKQRFQLFSGIISGPDLVEVARKHLGAAPIDTAERPPPKSAACVMLGLNGAGIATGEVFVSSLPWAMARIVASAGSTAPIDFRGFLGLNGLEQIIQKRVADLLLERKLLADPAAVAQADAAAPQASGQATAAPPVRAVTSDDIAAITELIFELSGWRPAQMEAWRIKAFKASEKDDDSPAVRENPLNSFYAEDLERLGSALESGDIGAGLGAYLHGEDLPGRIDLEHDVGALVAGVHPSRTPHACWPGKFPLVTAQQFAVNTILRELGAGAGIFAVNGPPGTGKTTMLKDIVAAVVLSRAEVLAEFDRPDAAFKGNLDIEDYPYSTHMLDERLRGFGLVVASANNGAVENISRELPGLGAIAPGLDVDYFSEVADSVAASAKTRRRAPQRERWGLIAAVLGNKENRGHFVNRFWFAGVAPKDKKDEPLDPLRMRSVKELVRAGEHGALPWAQARAQYREAALKVESLTAAASEAVQAMSAVRVHASTLENARTAIASRAAGLQGLLDAAAAAAGMADKAASLAQEGAARLASIERLGQAHQRATQAQQALTAREAGMPPGGLDGARALHAQAQRDIQNLREDHDRHLHAKPGLLSQLFRTEFSRRWNARGAAFEGQLTQARTAEQAAAAAVLSASSLAQEIDGERARLLPLLRQVEQLEEEVRRAGITADDTESALRLRWQDLARDAEATRQLAARAQADVDTAQEELGTLRQASIDAEAAMLQAQRALDSLGLSGAALRAWDLHGLERENRHSVSPYDTPALFAARRDLFIAAMDLHKAFIVASWRKLERTLGAFVNVLSGSLSPAKVRDGVAHLWDAFFLVVPLVSTTFASFPRLFAGIKREQLAWLLIDEAGQATPQQAAGAIWRAKRTVVVGDPLQLKPVVAVPEELIAPLLARSRAEPQWAPPATSTQTLADRANRFGMYLRQDDGAAKVWLGSPLLVHRRCLDPMFSIANDIAYENKMVYGTAPDDGAVGIGPSCWIDIRATSSEGHWIEEQGHKAIELVEQLTGGVLSSNGQFKVYIVTPFRSVAAKIKGLLDQRYKKASEGMAGTVHTFQGKEAEHVIFLLGGDPRTPGVIASYAGKDANLVNVAVTRAKRRLYVIGDRDYWTGPGDVHRIFSRMAEQLPVAPA